MATLAQRLVEAEAALHDISLGRGVVEVRDQNGELCKYGPANLPALTAYIARLKRQIAGVGLPKTILFRTSKGLRP